jgi:PII-like signaling protein
MQNSFYPIIKASTLRLFEGSNTSFGNCGISMERVLLDVEATTIEGYTLYHGICGIEINTEQCIAFTVSNSRH